MNIIISDSESDIEITHVLFVLFRKRSRVLTEEPRLLSENNDDHMDNGSTSSNAALQILNLGSLKELWNNGDYYEEVSRWEIVILAAHKCRSGSFANAEILSYGDMAYSIADFDAVKSIEDNVLGRKLKNFDMLRQWINASVPSNRFQV